MAKDFFEKEFTVFCAASYGVESPYNLPDRQRLEVEAAYYMGANVGFHHGVDCEDTAGAEARAELIKYGHDIIKRHERAGLPTGQRRS